MVSIKELRDRLRDSETRGDRDLNGNELFFAVPPGVMQSVAITVLPEPQ
jgi:hypothetical protein